MANKPVTELEMYTNEFMRGYDYKFLYHSDSFVCPRCHLLGTSDFAANQTRHYGAEYFYRRIIRQGDAILKAFAISLVLEDHYISWWTDHDVPVSVDIYDPNSLDILEAWIVRVNQSYPGQST